MKKKSITYIIVGIIILAMGINFSTSQYNAVESFGTVHEFTYGCITQSQEFVETYGNINNPAFCQHNAVLSIIVFSLMGAGIFLIVKSIKINKSNID